MRRRRFSSLRVPLISPPRLRVEPGHPLSPCRAGLFGPELDHARKMRFFDIPLASPGARDLEFSHTTRNTIPISGNSHHAMPLTQNISGQLPQVPSTRHPVSPVRATTGMAVSATAPQLRAAVEKRCPLFHTSRADQIAGSSIGPQIRTIATQGDNMDAMAGTMKTLDGTMESPNPAIEALAGAIEAVFPTTEAILGTIEAINRTIFCAAGSFALVVLGI